MSGHSGFIAIGNNLPNNPINIGNVGNVRPSQNVNPQPVNPGSEAPADAAPEKSGPGELVRQLDVLLLQAAKVSTKGIDAEVLKGQARTLGLGKKELRTLNTLIDKAATTMAALDKFTGRELATATVMDINLRSVWDTRKPAGTAIQAALDAQAALSERLFELISSKGIPRETKAALESAAMTCDRRSCEIQTLVMQFSDAIAKVQYADIKTLDKDVQARLDTKLFALMGEKALSMHGNAEALAQMRAKLEPLGKRLDDFSANPDKNITSAAFASMRKELADAKEAVATLARDGYQAGDGRVMPDKAFLDAAKEILAQVEKRMDGARQRLAQAALRSYVDSLFAPPPDLKLLDPKFRTLLNFLSPQTVKLAIAMDDVLAAARKYAEDPTPQNHEALEDVIDGYNQDGLAKGAKYVAENLFNNAETFLITHDSVLNGKIAKLPKNVRATITPELIEEYKKAATEFTRGEGPRKAFEKFFKNDHNFKTQLAHFEDMLKTVKRMGDEDFLTSKTFLSAFKGELAPSILVEARVHGMRDDDVDPATDPSNVRGSKAFGSGQFNTVTAVAFKNGEIKVFKPEAPGRAGMERAPYVFEGYEKSQMVSQLNMATQKTADVLGLGDVMAKTSVGKFNGQYGIFMEKVKGNVAPEFLKNDNISRGSLGRIRVQMLSNEGHARVQGQIMRKCNRLDWFDAITGQGDRHNGNVLINVAQGGTVDVKGIDNDTCFPAHRIGLNKYVVAGKHLVLFRQTLENISELYGKHNKQAAMQRLLADKGVTENDDGTYTLDSSKFEAPELNYCLMYTFGMFSNHVPNAIDQDLYDRLQTLKAGPAREDYIADLKTRLPPASVNAAILRLDDAIRRADELKAKGKVYSETDWNDREKQKTVYNDPDDQMPRLEPQFGTKPRKNIRCSAQLTNAIHSMTQGNYKRQQFDLSAKTDWFR